MKKIILLLAITLSSCDGDHDHQVNKKFPKLKRPIIIIAKMEGDLGSSVIVRDANDSVLLTGNASTIGRIIGASYNIGDTIK